MRLYIRKIGTREYFGPMDERQLIPYLLDFQEWEGLEAKGQTHGQVVKSSDWAALSSLTVDKDCGWLVAPSCPRQGLCERSRYQQMRRWIDRLAWGSFAVLLLSVIGVIIDIPGLNAASIVWDAWMSLLFEKCGSLVLGGFLIASLRCALVLFLDQMDLKWDAREEN